LLPGMGYDRAITVFSPDGRLWQVDYATIMVNNSPTAIGASSTNGVVLAGIERKTEALQDRSFSHKIFIIDDHAATAVTGFTSDARILVDMARQESQLNRLLYDEPIDMGYLARKLGDMMQAYTQNAGVRPFGVSLIIGGVDLLGPSVHQLDPSGIYNKYFLTASGMNRNEALETTKSIYDKSASLETLKEMTVIGMIASNKSDVSPEIIRMVTIDSKEKRAVIVKDEEISELFQRASKKQPPESAKK